MSDRLHKRLTVDIEAKKPETYEERMEEALRRALETTTIHRPGVPWEYEESKPDNKVAIWIPGSEE